MEEKARENAGEAAVKALGGEAGGLLPALITTLHKTTNVVTESALRNAIVRYTPKGMADEVTSQVVALLRKDNDWFRQKILLELLKAMKTKAGSAAAQLQTMIRGAGNDKSKKDYLQGILEAVGGKS